LEFDDCFDFDLLIKSDVVDLKFDVSTRLSGGAREYRVDITIRVRTDC
jgi:hypothetical protein